MSRYHAAEEDRNQPVMWLQGHAIYAAHFIVVVYVASMLLTTLFMAFKFDAWFAWLPFSSAAVWQGQAWRVVTYGLVNPPSLSFIVDMFMLAWFGRELEKFFGRRTFLLLYGSLYLLSPVLFTAIGPWLPMQLAGETGGFALFIAFATLYPGVALLFGILASWIALILVGIYTLAAVAGRNPTSLIELWVTVGFAFAFVRYHQGRWALPRFRWPRRQPQFRVLPGDGARESPLAAKPSSQSVAEVDALLDKIAESGMASLTPAERAKLDQSRAEILRRMGTNRR